MIADQLPHPISALRRQAGLVTPRPHPTPKSEAPLVGLLEAGDPKGEVRNAWHAKEVVRSVHAIDDPELAVEFVTQLGIDLRDDSCPPEVQRFGRTITKWRRQIAAWHQAKFTNGPTEAVNNLIKGVKRVAFGITNWTNYRTRSLLYAGKPDWSLLTITPR
jgi:transposase